MLVILSGAKDLANGARFTLVRSVIDQSWEIPLFVRDDKLIRTGSVRQRLTNTLLQIDIRPRRQAPAAKYHAAREAEATFLRAN